MSWIICPICEHFSCILQGADPWHPVREFLNAFNENMQDVLTPGKFLTVDEIMSRWLGLESQHAAEGLPHATKIARKPEGIGAEMKAVADGETGCIIGVEMMEGRARMATRPFAQEYQAGTATVLRLCWPWRGSGRIVIADSAFASVKTLIAVKNLLGLFFMGAVKTAHTLYPRAYFTAWSQQEHARGSWITLRSSHKGPDPKAIDSFPMYAVGWHDKKVKQIICNCGTTTRSETDSLRPRHCRVEVNNEFQTEIRTLAVPRPVAIEMFFRHFSAIDVHDHYRQGILAFERTWKTQTWWMRIFGTLFGVIVTNSYLMYRFEYNRDVMNDPENMLTFIDFADTLVQQLINNRPQTEMALRRPAAEPIQAMEEEHREGRGHIITTFTAKVNVFLLPPNSDFHFVKPLSSILEYKDLPNPNNRAKRRCHVQKCGEICSHYCVKCTNFAEGKIFALCSSEKSHSKNCFYKHIELVIC